VFELVELAAGFSFGRYHLGTGRVVGLALESFLLDLSHQGENVGSHRLDEHRPIFLYRLSK
jgi:hypothetical protein